MFLGGDGVGFLTTLRVEVGFFVRLRMSNLIIHHAPKLGISVEMAQFLLTILWKQRFRAVHHDFH